MDLRHLAAEWIERLVRSINATRRPVQLNPRPRNLAANESVQILPGKANRRVLLIQNVGASVVWLGFDSQASPHGGVRLAPAGGTLYMAEPAPDNTIYAYSETVAGELVAADG